MKTDDAYNGEGEDDTYRDSESAEPYDAEEVEKLIHNRRAGYKSVGPRTEDADSDEGDIL